MYLRCGSNATELSIHHAAMLEVYLIEKELNAEI